MHFARDIVITQQGREIDITNKPKGVDEVFELNRHMAEYLSHGNKPIKGTLQDQGKTEEKMQTKTSFDVCTPIEQFSFLEDIFSDIKKVAKELGIDYCSISTPILFLPNERLLKLQELFGLESFMADSRYLLPPASDFGVFTMLADKAYAKEKLPYRVFEKAVCFRKEKKEDGMSRFLSFHLPDFHSLVSEDTVEDEILCMMQLNAAVLDDLPFFVALRVTEEEYEKRVVFLKQMAKQLNQPIVINILENTIRYWCAKWKYLYRDIRNNYIQLSTVQLDYITPKLFGMENVDAVVHASPGSIERIIYVIMDQKNRLRKG